MKVLFICKQRNNAYGISVGLSNSAKFVAQALNKRDIKAEVITVNDANDIDREVTLRDPEFVVLEALWITPTKLREILSIRRHQDRVWTIRIHSKTPFLANEGIAMEWIYGYNLLRSQFPNLNVSANNIDFVNDLGEVTNTFIEYLPNIYEPTEPERVRVPKPASDYLDIGCFGAIRPLKNHLQQAFAAVIFSERIGKRLRFHINSSRTEQKGDEVLKNLRGLFAGLPQHELVEHPWMSHEDFMKIANFMDVGMQVSLSESFNIVTADMVSQKVPVVVSTDVTWMPTNACAVPTDTKDILYKLEKAYRYPLASSRQNFKYLQSHNKKALKAWCDYLILSEEEMKKMLPRKWYHHLFNLFKTKGGSN